MEQKPLVSVQVSFLNIIGENVTILLLYILLFTGTIYILPYITISAIKDISYISIILVSISTSIIAIQIFSIIKINLEYLDTSAIGYTFNRYNIITEIHSFLITISLATYFTTFILLSNHKFIQ